MFGTDASEQMVALLKDSNNILQAVTGQDPYAIGVQTMTSVINVLEGKAEPTHEAIIVPGILLTRDDPDGLAAFLADLQAKIQ